MISFHFARISGLALFFCLLAAGVPRAEQIVADRPGFGSSTGIVPRSMLQVEGGYRFGRTGGYREHTLGELLLRMPLLDRMEFDLGVSSYLVSRSPGAENSGLGDCSFGAKLKLREGAPGPGLESLDIAALVSTTIPAGSRPYRTSKLQPSVMLVTAWSLNENVELSPFFSYTLASGNSDQFDVFGGGVSVGFALPGRWGCFLEYYGSATESAYGPGLSYLDGGVTWLLAGNCQLDLHSGFALNGESPEYFVGMGFAYRFEFGQ